MEEYKITFDIEPTDEYIKARKDFREAMSSIQKLTPQEQQALAKEIFGAESVKLIMDMMQQYFNACRNNMKGQRQ